MRIRNRQIDRDRDKQRQGVDQTSKSIHRILFKKTFFFYVSKHSLLYLLYFFLPLVPIGVAGGHSCLSAARWVAWRRDIP